MHIDFDLKSPCPVARIFLLLLGRGHAAGHAVYPHVGRHRRPRADTRRETATRYTADATSRGNDRVVEVSELVFDVDRVPRY